VLGILPLTINFMNSREGNIDVNVWLLIVHTLKNLIPYTTSNKESRGKVALKWDGLLKVIRVVKTNTYHLQDIKVKNLPHAW
jgi:VanZ family protein